MPGDPTLASLIPFANQQVAGTVSLPDNLGPALTNEQINTGFGFDPNTINDSNRLNAATFSSAAGPIFSEGNSVAQLPTFKGTWFLEQDNEGTSESYYWTGDTPATYGGMLNAMITLAPFRLALSQGPDEPKCTNPLSLVAVRVENEQISRDAQTLVAPQISQLSFTKGVGTVFTQQYGNESWNNDDADAAWKVSFTDGLGHSAIQYLHGVPYYSFQGAASAGGTVPLPNQGSRTTQPYSKWVQNLVQFCNALRAQNLGLRYATVQWTPGGVAIPGPSGPVAATGNGTPVAVTYNYPGTPQNTYTFQMSTVPTPATLPYGKFICIVRQMKALRVIEGRWPANFFLAAAGTPYAGTPCVNIFRRAAQYMWDGAGYLSPLIWSTLVPSLAYIPTPNGNQPVPSGVGAILLTGKKTGRPFDLQRGRLRNRVT